MLLSFPYALELCATNFELFLHITTKDDRNLVLIAIALPCLKALSLHFNFLFSLKLLLVTLSCLCFLNVVRLSMSFEPTV